MAQIPGLGWFARQFGGGGQQQGPPAAHTVDSGSTPYFQGLTHESAVIDINFDKTIAFKRAIKVFLMSYPELRATNQTVFQALKYNEYVNQMEQLYGLSNASLTFTPQMYKDLRSENYDIVFVCKKVNETHRLTAPRFVVNLKGVIYSIALDVTNDEQPYCPIVISVSYDIYTHMRRDPSYMAVLNIEDQTQQFTPFNFVFAKSHPEGFYEWIDFEGVELLINVEYTAKQETAVTQEEVSKFHLQTIYQMLSKRLSMVRTRPQHAEHQQTAFKYSVSYIRPNVNPQTDDFFWTAPNLRTAQHLRRRTTTVKFIDIQCSYQTNSDFEDSVCLCNEWCNWNAFFYHNPIYRFLLVQHRKLFVKNISNIPDMYLTIAVILGTKSAPNSKTPVLPLVKCANDYRKRYYDSYYLKNHVFKHLYDTNLPSPHVMNGVAYNMLRNQMQVTELCHQMATDPLSDNCIDNLLYYYTVLTDLHFSISRLPAFVSDQINWSFDFDSLTRIKYNDYIKRSYEKCMSSILGGYDYMFTIDFEHTFRVIDERVMFEDIPISKRRNNVLNKSSIDSPFNLKVTLNDFSNIFVAIYKFLARVEPILPGSHENESRGHILLTYREMDAYFDVCESVPSMRFNQLMRCSLNFHLNDNEFPHLDQSLHLFYTLKLYLCAFEIQRHFIKSVVNYNNTFTYKGHQTCDVFNFIWKYRIIEHKYRTAYPGESLYEIQPIDNLFADFYHTFWGKAEHELHGLPSYPHYLRSALTEYKRLYFWLRNDGNNRRKFVRIIELLNNNLQTITDRSERIYLEHMIPAVADLSQTYAFHYEVFDHLFYYLVKSHCSMTLNTLANLLKPLHGLQVHVNCQANVSFSMAKPGLVPLFLTMARFMRTIDEIKVCSVVFDDECDRIVNTCDQSMRMIKDIFRQFYHKLVFEWLEEMYFCYDDPQTVQYGDASTFLVLHLAVGLSFAARFIDTFRNDFVGFRKKCLQKLNQIPTSSIRHQVHFADSRRAVRNYIGDRNLIRDAMPFRSNPWTQQLRPLFQQYDQLTAQQLNIDMNAADV